ncbi:rod shape-determining protein MreD [bacterium]|nr:rod shape-determining protein MreD [bacterium]
MKNRILFLILLSSVILQATIVPYMTIGWFRPDITLLVIIWISVRKSTVHGIIAGFIAGLLVDAFNTQFMGLSSLTYSITAFIIGRIYTNDIAMIVPRWIQVSGLGAFVFSILFAFFYSLDSTPSFTQLLFKHTVPMALYTWSIAILWGLSPIYEKR